MKNLQIIAIIVLTAISGVLGAACLAFKSDADAAEAHATAADERSAGCEAKFQTDTVIVEPFPFAADQNPGVNLYHGMFRLSLNSTAPLTGAPSYNAIPRFVIPAKITPRAAGGDPAIYGSGPVYFWVNRQTHEQKGPYPIGADLAVR